MQEITIPKENRIQTIILLFLIMSIIGYIWEIAAFLLMTDSSYSIPELLRTYHGVLHGPWVPIYGFGGLAMLSFKPLYGNKPLVFFWVCVIVSAIIEYSTSWALEKMFNARWWDYTGFPLQLNGRICLTNCLFFGIGGCIAAYILEPGLRKIMPHIKGKSLNIICFILTALFVIDYVSSIFNPNMGLGVLKLGK